MNYPTCPFESLSTCMIFDSRDWSQDRKDAWLYGICVGWNDASLKELKLKHDWDDETINRLRMLRGKFKEASNLQNKLHTIQNVIEKTCADCETRFDDDCDNCTGEHVLNVIKEN